MTFLDRYLAKLFAKNLLLVLATLLAIYLLSHFFERIDDFMRANESMTLAAKYFLLKLPQMIEELTPIAILLGGIISLGLINHQGELMVLRAGGIQTMRIITPFLVAAVFFNLVTLALAEWVVPPTVAQTNKILFEQVRNEKPKGIVRHGRLFYRDDEGIYSFDIQKPVQNRFEHFTFTTWDGSYKLKLLLSAQTAFWDNGTWTLIKGQAKQGSGSGNYEIDFFQERNFPLKATPADFFTPVYKINEMSLSKLFARGSMGNGPENIKARFKFFERLSLNVLGIPLLLLGIPILMLAHQKWRRDISIAIPISCGLALAVWACWGTLQSLAKGGILHPQLAAWSVHLLVGSLGFFMILRQDR
jgi:lipopolysaccharide export system permease protein